MASKKSISRAAQNIIKGGTVDIKKALQEANKALDKLKKENALLKEQIKNLSKSNKEQRQKIKSQAGQLKAAETKVQTLKQAVKIEKRKRIKAQKAAAKLRTPKTPKSPKPKSYIDNLPKEERRKIYQSTIYVPQFARRLQQHYGEKWKQEWTFDVIRVLNQLDPNLVKELIYALDLKKTYWESDQYFTDETTDWEAEYVYNTIMSYEN